MGSGEIIAIALITVIIVGAAAYIIKAKRSGKKCIGCPDSASCGKGHSCSGHCSGCCSCDTNSTEEDSQG